jgi:3-oxoacyl-[acyl-carrier protein] reductase
MALSKAGARVVVAARNRERLEDAAAEIRGQGGDAYAVEIELSSADSIREAFAKAATDFGAVQILVNNAGVTRDGLAMRMKREDWNAVLETNLTGAFLCIQQVMPAMVKARWGRIVNITSVVGQTGSPGQANYVASKSGLIGLTKSLAQELASRNITVNAVAPGFIATDMTAVLTGARKEAILGRIPLNRLGTPEEVASAVKYLASEEASYVTGAVLEVNGGMYM